MRFSPSFLDEIKARLPVSEVVRRRVKLQKAGREWRGLSPFTAEKSPSFFVNDAKQAWFDFSSGQNGNVFDFVMRTEGLNFPETVERLAGEAGLALPAVSEDTERRDRQRAGLQEVLEEATRFFEAALGAAGGARARAYLAGRGIAPAVQRDFRLGYAPADRFTLRDHLASKGAAAETMIEAGLLVHGEDVPVPFGRFRDRVIFPICDRGGRVIAFGGRAMGDDVQPKYLNSPETPVFHKGAVLYNWNKARKAAHETGRLVVVEGYVDVIAVATAGFPAVVAPLGTALTADQCGLLWKMAEEPILCFDGDRAGRKAADRAVDLALPMVGPGRTLSFAFLPEGQDPDDLARSGGPDAIRAVLDNARPLVEVLWQRDFEATPLDTPERRASLERRLLDRVATIADETMRSHYRDEIRSRLAALRPQAPSRFGNARPGPRAPAAVKGRFVPPPTGYVASAPAVSSGLQRTSAFAGSGIPRREAEILINLINHPALLAQHAEEISALELASRDAVRLRDGLLAFAHEDHPEDTSIRAALDRAGLSPSVARLEGAVEPVPWSLKADAALADAEQSLKQALVLHRKSRALHKELKLAELELGRDATVEAFARLRDIQDELATLEGREAVLDGFGAASGRGSWGV